jgi:hypothetical protein
MGRVPHFLTEFVRLGEHVEEKFSIFSIPKREFLGTEVPILALLGDSEVPLTPDCHPVGKKYYLAILLVHVVVEELTTRFFYPRVWIT